VLSPNCIFPRHAVDFYDSNHNRVNLNPFRGEHTPLLSSHHYKQKEPHLNWQHWVLYTPYVKVAPEKIQKKQGDAAMLGVVRILR
jgi:hypothetical protein